MTPHTTSFYCFFLEKWVDIIFHQIIGLKTFLSIIGYLFKHGGLTWNKKTFVVFFHSLVISLNLTFQQIPFQNFTILKINKFPLN